jgi:signal transduction histidine kinase
MEIVRSTEAMFTLRAHQKGISFAVNLDQSADIWCLGDPTRIKQVLYNLVSNAVKFTQDGSVLVTIAAEDVGEGRRALSFAIKDTGIGIEPEVQNRLFERFKVGLCLGFGLIFAGGNVSAQALLLIGKHGFPTRLGCKQFIGSFCEFTHRNRLPQ